MDDSSASEVTGDMDGLFTFVDGGALDSIGSDVGGPMTDVSMHVCNI